jgi:hypothetical protein
VKAKLLSANSPEIWALAEVGHARHGSAATNRQRQEIAAVPVTPDLPGWHYRERTLAAKHQRPTPAPMPARTEVGGAAFFSGCKTQWRRDSIGGFWDDCAGCFGQDDLLLYADLANARNQHAEAPGRSPMPAGVPPRAEVVNATRDGRGIGSLGDWSVGPKVSDSGVVACERRDRRVGSVSRTRARNEENGRPTRFPWVGQIGYHQPNRYSFPFSFIFLSFKFRFSFPFWISNSTLNFSYGFAHV